jgi:hypothetical protein
MTSKFSRFMNLERSRGERPAPQEPSRLQSGNRFETLSERPEAPQEAAVPETHLERFRGQAPLALEAIPEEEQRFPRCGSCQSDSGRFATECSACGADLTTPQQRAFNEQLWQQRRQEAAQEREATANLSQQRQEQERLEDSARYGEMLKKLREEEQSRTGWNRITSHGNLALALLSFIPSRFLRGLLLVALIATPCWVWREELFQHRGRHLSGSGILVGILVLFLLVPTGDRPRSRWWQR